MSVKLYGKAKRINARRSQVEAVLSSSEQEWAGQRRISMIQALIPLGLRALEEELQAEVAALVGGTRYEPTHGTYRRWGANPGSVHLGDQKLRINVPRVRDLEAGQEVKLRSYEARQDPSAIDERALAHVIHGMSQGRYERAAERVPETFGISKSSVSRKFIRASARRLEQFMNRDLSGHDIVAVFIDGKCFAENQIVIALGVTIAGDKVLLGFVETSTENHGVCKQFLLGLRERGLRLDQEILWIVDGGKGLHKGIREVMGPSALIARCQWHKRENVLSYLGKQQQAEFRRKLQSAYEEPSYELAKKRLQAIRQELRQINASAVASLDEGLEETLLLQRLGMFERLGKSFKTTNCIENVNKQLELCTGRVTRWRNSDQRQRWVAAALLEIEPRLNKVMGHEYLGELRAAMKRFNNSRVKQEIAA